MALWEHTDEDGDRVYLSDMNVPGLYAIGASEDGEQTVVHLDEDALFRLRDVIEKISTS